MEVTLLMSIATIDFSSKAGIKKQHFCSSREIHPVSVCFGFNIFVQLNIKLNETPFNNLKPSQLYIVYFVATEIGSERQHSVNLVLHNIFIIIC